MGVRNNKFKKEIDQLALDRIEESLFKKDAATFILSDAIGQRPKPKPRFPPYGMTLERSKRIGRLAVSLSNSPDRVVDFESVEEEKPKKSVNLQSFREAMGKRI